MTSFSQQGSSPSRTSSSTASSDLRRALWTERARRNPGDPHAWMMAHRSINGGPPIHLPALADMARDRHSMIVIQKSAQVGVSELVLNCALHAADTGYAGRGNVLLLMPTQNQADYFVNGRVNRAIQDSPCLRGRLQPEPPRRKSADNTRLKRLGPGPVYFRGAESKRQIASIDADLVILDEYDQMAEGVLDLAMKRLASSAAPRLIAASTPRRPEAGVNALYLQSDQRRYFIVCRQCGLGQDLQWELNVDTVRGIIVCRGCRSSLDASVDGHWTAQAPGNERVHGYHFRGVTARGSTSRQ